VFQGEQRFQPGFFGFSVQFDVFPAFGEGRHRQKGDDDTFDKGTAFFRSIRGSLMSLKKSMMGGYGFGDHYYLQSHLYRLFLSLLYPFLMRPPWSSITILLTFRSFLINLTNNTL
jgi:hypothetical protein